MENINFTTISDPITDALKELFGMDYLFPYQRLVIGNILEAAEESGINVRWSGSADEESPDEVVENGEAEDEDEVFSARMNGANGVNGIKRDVSGRQIVILPTGAGKSLCFQLPAMMMDGPTLVIYPILSLMADQERRLVEKNFSPVLLRGGQSREERTRIWQKLESGESRFIIANPEVLLSGEVMEALPRLGIVHIVIDEAHCVSEWGESFRPSYLEINKIVKTSNAPIVTAFTATASAGVLEKIDKYIFGDEGGAHRIIGNPDRSNISYWTQGCVLKDIAVRDILRESAKPAIVFCSSRPGTEKLARYLRETLETKEVRFYHAGLEREEKTCVEKWFFGSPDGILTATCAYGMGVDKSNIRTVVHRDCPPSVEAYLQESGRAGRDGAPSRAYLLWGPEDEYSLLRARKQADKDRLQALFAFARGTERCRREVLMELLNYTGEGSKPEECCDVCEGRALGSLREEESFRGFFRRNARCWTAKEAGGFISDLTVQKGGDRRLQSAEARNAVKWFLQKGVLKESRLYPRRGVLRAGE